MFPSEWRAWAEPQTAPWKPLGTVITRRLEREREAIRVLDELAAPRPGELSRLHDKVYGCILAGAIGNAMGSPVEGRFYWEIDKDYPDGITTVLEPRRLELDLLLEQEVRVVVDDQDSLLDFRITHASFSCG